MFTQILAIFRKDLRLLRWPLLAHWLAAALHTGFPLYAYALATRHAPEADAASGSGFSLEGVGFALSAAYVFSLLYLGARLSTLDHPRRDDAFWRSRAIPTRALLAAKLGFVALLVGVPGLLLHVAVFLPAQPTGAELFASLPPVIVSRALLPLGMLVLGAYFRGPWRGLFWCLVTVFAVHLVTLVLKTNDHDAAWLANEGADVIVFAIAALSRGYLVLSLFAIAGAAWIYHARALGRARLLALGGFVLGLLGARIFGPFELPPAQRYLRAISARSPSTEAAAEELAVSAQIQRDASTEQNEINIGVRRITRRDAGEYLSLTGVRSTFSTARETLPPVLNSGASSPVLGDIAVLHHRDLSTPRASLADQHAGSVVHRRITPPREIRRTNFTWSGELYFTAYRAEAGPALPLRAGANVDAGPVRLHIEKVEVDRDAIHVSLVLLRPHNAGFTANRHFEPLFLLNDVTGEGLPLKSFGGASLFMTGGPWVAYRGLATFSGRGDPARDWHAWATQAKLVFVRDHALRQFRIDATVP